MAEQQIDTDLMLKFVEKVQANECVKETVPQFRLTINNVTKQLSAVEQQTIYTNYSSDKRYFNGSVSKSKLWAYGTTQYT